MKKSKADLIRGLTDDELVQVYELFKIALQSQFLSIIVKVEPTPNTEPTLELDKAGEDSS